MKGKFIVVEGIDGAGKTSAIQQVSRVLYDNGISNLVFTHEPGGTPLADILCSLIKNGITGESITNYAELLMLYAARVQLVEHVIKPALISGAWVLGDRHALSSIAYQGGGRGIDKHVLTTLHSIILGNFYPDLTLFLNVSPEIGISRVNSRNKMDRIEKEPLDFFHRTSNYYQILISNNDRIITIDANQSKSIVDYNIQRKLKKWLYTQIKI